MSSALGEEHEIEHQVKNRVQDSDSDEVITEKLKRQGVKISKGGVTPFVFWPSLIVVLAVAIIAIAAPEATGDALLAMQGWIVGTLGWWYMLVIAAFIVFALVVAFSKYGSIKLG